MGHDPEALAEDAVFTLVANGDKAEGRDAATGREVDVPLAVFYTVEDRGITEGHAWFMVSAFLEQVS